MERNSSDDKNHFWFRISQGISHNILQCSRSIRPRPSCPSFSLQFLGSPKPQSELGGETVKTVPVLRCSIFCLKLWESAAFPAEIFVGAIQSALQVIIKSCTEPRRQSRLPKNSLGATARWVLWYCRLISRILWKGQFYWQNSGS